MKIVRRIFCVLSVLFFSASVLPAQPAIEWESYFSKSPYDRPYGLCTNMTGEIMVCGTTWNDSSKSYDGILIKLDFSGNKIWQRVIGYGNTDILTAVASLPTGGFIAAGRTDSKGEGSHDFWIIRLDEKGNFLWEKTYGGKFEDKAEHLLVLKSGEILVCGSRMTAASSTIEGWVLKLSSEGEKIWDKQIGGHYRTTIRSSAELNDRIILAGYFDPGNQEKFQANKGYVAAIDMQGKTIFEKIVGGPFDASKDDRDDELSDVQITTRGNIVVCGSTESKGKNGNADFWIMQMNSEGIVSWEQVVGDISADHATGMALDDSGIVVCGETSSRISNSDDIYNVKLDYSGNILWTQTLGNELNEKPFRILSVPDGGWLLAAERCTHYQYDSKPVQCGMDIIKLAGTPEKSIQQYIHLKVSAWEKKGEFEKTDSFQKRVTEDNRKTIVEKHTREAIAYYASRSFDWSQASLGEYDADKEEFLLKVNGLEPLRIRIPVENAQSFKENFSSVQFENQDYEIKDGKFVLKTARMVVENKEYTFSSEKNDSAAFLLTGERKVQESNQLRGTGDPIKGLNLSKAKAVLMPGKYYALIIGIDNYKGSWPQLQNAVHDAQAVELLLKGKYKFDHFKTLYDEQATRVNIMNAMEWLVNNTGENDNVLIYYSGHGDYRKDLNKGYWVPSDAQTLSLSAYISNSDLQTFLGGIQSKHTLLVSDACFSGDIFRGNTVVVKMETPEKYYSETYNLKSRQALTSGGVEPVMDGGKDGHSIFAYYFLQALKNNENTYVDASQIFEKLKIPVTNNSDQKPILQPVKNAGDEGGQFIFIRK